jgi:hypothetical protein
MISGGRGQFNYLRLTFAPPSGGIAGISALTPIVGFDAAKSRF